MKKAGLVEGLRDPKGLRTGLQTLVVELEGL